MSQAAAAKAAAADRRAAVGKRPAVRARPASAATQRKRPLPLVSSAAPPRSNKKPATMPPMPNLEGADLTDADLRDVYLYGANLGEANLSRANLSNSKIYYHQLKAAFLCNTPTLWGELSQGCSAY